MTTMDSDSESQDSDEGRRFRFEATRKDSNSGGNSRRRKSSPSSSSRGQNSRRSRSRDRTNRDDRRDNSDRSRRDYRNNKKELSSRGSSKYSRDFSKNKETTSRLREKKNLPRGSRESRNYEKKIRSNDRATAQDDKNFTEKRDKSRDRSKRYSRERSRERSSQSVRTSKQQINDVVKTRDDFSRNEISGKKKPKKTTNDARTGSRSNDLTLKMKKKHDDSTAEKDSRPLQDCKDLNLSDFDIVSDTEENSSDNSLSRRFHEETSGNNDEFIKNEPATKRRVTRHHYERLLKRQATKNRRNLELFPKVELINGNHEISKNNAVIRDFLLASDVKKITRTTSCSSSSSSSSSKMTIDEFSTVDKDEEIEIFGVRSQIDDDKAHDAHLEESRSNDSTHGHALPPKNSGDNTSSRDKMVSREKKTLLHKMASREKETLVDEMASREKETLVDKMASREKETLVDKMASREKETLVDKMASWEKETLVHKMASREKETLVDKMASREKETLVDKMASREKETLVDKMASREKETSVDEMASREKETLVDKMASREKETLVDKMASREKETSVDKMASYEKTTPRNKMASQDPILLSSRVDDEKVVKAASRIIGPTLPENLRDIAEGEDDNETEDTFGPALPPHLSQPNNYSVVVEKGEKNEQHDEISSASEDEDFMGPLPVDHPALENDAVQQQLERRARRLKAELAACDNEDEKKREEWMLELPSVKSANLGLGPRKFRARPAPDMSDRSSWTDTPADRARKQMEKLENKSVCEPMIRPSERDTSEASIELEKSRKRQRSLLEMHQKKLHKKKKKEEKEAKKIGKTAERRPFDRDIDLQANRFDEARKKSMFLKARELDDRFSRGKI